MTGLHRFDLARGWSWFGQGSDPGGFRLFYGCSFIVLIVQEASWTGGATIRQRENLLLARPGSALCGNLVLVRIKMLVVALKLLFGLFVRIIAAGTAVLAWSRIVLASGSRVVVGARSVVALLLGIASLSGGATLPTWIVIVAAGSSVRTFRALSAWWLVWVALTSSEGTRLVAGTIG